MELFSIWVIKAYLVLKKEFSFINKNQNLHCEYMFCVWNFNESIYDA